jgi:hypothetical protein
MPEFKTWNVFRFGSIEQSNGINGLHLARFFRGDLRLINMTDSNVQFYTKSSSAVSQ